jgi:hypothetical protein
MRAGYAGKCTVIAIFICLLFSCLSISTQAVIPDTGMITGYALDEDGNPVSAANVTLWQDGQFWQHTRVTYAGSENPYASDIHNGNEGYFIFGFVNPGSYTVKAEKDGYTGSASLTFNDKTVLVNVTITGYHVPSFSLEQLSYTGAITGTVYESSGQDMTAGANVSLWQDGLMVKIPGNPQVGIGSNYMFEHLPPGQYEVRAAMQYARVFRYNSAKISVNVSNSKVTADIELPFAAPHLSPTLLPTSMPSSSPSPSPSPGVAMVMLSLVIGILLFGIFWKAR